MDSIEGAKEIAIELLRAEKAELELLLGRYGRHSLKCENLLRDKICSCVCGWDKVVEKYSHKFEQPPVEEQDK